MNQFKAIAAMSENRVIGFGNRIPWHLPEDFKWFKSRPMGQVIVMGRKTYESIGRPLPGRETVVLSRTVAAIPGVRVIGSLEELDLSAEKREVFICGGAQLYSQTLDQCSDLFLTLVKRTVEGDAFFPEFESRFARVETLRDGPDFAIHHFRNRKSEA